jgi:hypothetical protein
MMTNYNFKTEALGASENYLAFYEDKSEEPNKGTLYLYYYPSLILCKSIVIFIKTFNKISQLEISQGYLIVTSSCFQIFSLPELNMM